MSMNASNITTGTLDATAVLFPDGSSLNTASRVITTNSTISAAKVASSTTVEPTGLGFTCTVEESTDVINIWGALVLTSNTSTPSPVIISVVEDVTIINQITLTSQPEGTFQPLPFFFSTSDIGPGAHDFQLSISLTSAADTPVALQASDVGTYMIGQLVF